MRADHRVWAHIRCVPGARLSLHTSHGWWTGIRAGLAFTFSLPWLPLTIFGFALINIAVLGALAVALPLLVRDARVSGGLTAALGAGLANLILALVLSGWVSYCRVVRGEVLALGEREFVLAARVVGASGARIVSRHLLPNVLAPILVLATLEMGTVIIAEAALSFLGLGVGASRPGAAC